MADPWEDSAATGYMVNPPPQDVRARWADADALLLKDNVLAKEAPGVLRVIADFALTHEMVLLGKEATGGESWTLCWDHDRMERAVHVLVRRPAPPMGIANVLLTVRPGAVALEITPYARWNLFDGRLTWWETTNNAPLLLADPQPEQVAQVLEAVAEVSNRFTPADLREVGGSAPH